jgi:hypothetical protein
VNNPPSDATQIIRRTNTTTRARFTSRPKPEPQKAPDGTESILGAPAPTNQRLTDRQREISGDLPEWDLLPPGEITVRRK